MGSSKKHGHEGQTEGTLRTSEQGSLGASMLRRSASMRYTPSRQGTDVRTKPQAQTQDTQNKALHMVRQGSSQALRMAILGNVNQGQSTLGHAGAGTLSGAWSSKSLYLSEKGGTLGSGFPKAPPTATRLRSRPIPSIRIPTTESRPINLGRRSQSAGLWKLLKPEVKVRVLDEPHAHPPKAKPINLPIDITIL